MLSRVADSLYWMSRYLERVEYTARLIEENVNLALDLSPDTAERRWNKVLFSLAMPPREGPLDVQGLTHWMSMHHENRSSIVSCIMAARENARQVREQVSSEMWEQLNMLFHQVKRAGIEDIWDGQPLEFLRAVREGVHLFQGITDSTMSHGEGWQFIQVGRSIERAIAVSNLLDIHFRGFQARDWDTDPSEHLEWIGLLKSCTAFEAYCKEYTAELSPNRLAEFLLLNPEFPHSVRFSVDALHHGLTMLPETRKAGSVTRLSGKLRATLSYAQIDELFGESFHQHMSSIVQQCGKIHSAIYQVYIRYTIESALED